MTHNKTPQNKAREWPILRDLALSLDLPNVIEATSYRQPCLKAHKKLWTWCSPHADAFVFFVNSDERDMLISAQPERYFITDHYKGYDMVLVHPEEFDADWAAANLRRRWRALAGARFLAKYDAEHSRSD